MYAMSVIGMLALVRGWTTSRAAAAAALALYGVAAALAAAALAPH
jgi:hypothetical protein